MSQDDKRGRQCLRAMTDGRCSYPHCMCPVLTPAAARLPEAEPVAWLYEKPYPADYPKHFPREGGATVSAAAAGEYSSEGYIITPLFRVQDAPSSAALPQERRVLGDVLKERFEAEQSAARNDYWNQGRIFSCTSCGERVDCVYAYGLCANCRDKSPASSARARVFVCTCPSVRHAYSYDPQGHCPECVKGGHGNWSCIGVAVQHATASPRDANALAEELEQQLDPVRAKYCDWSEVPQIKVTLPASRWAKILTALRAPASATLPSNDGAAIEKCEKYLHDQRCGSVCGLRKLARSEGRGA